MDLFQGAAALLAALSGNVQHDRLLRLIFPRNDGPANVSLLANRLEADESLSCDFRYTVEVLATDGNLPLTGVIGKMATVSLVRDDGTLRHFNGYVFAFRFVRTDGGFAFYEMVLRPWLAFLELRRDCATFQNMTLSEISESTFEHYLERDYRLLLTQEEANLTLAIQYNESDYNHLHRRWEAAGLHYWYEHREDGHTLMLSDDSTQGTQVDGNAAIDYQSEAGALEADGIRLWGPARQLASALFRAGTHDFKNNRADWADRPSVEPLTVAALEHTEYVGAYGFNDADGDALAQRRMEQIDSTTRHWQAAGNHRAIQPGRTFRLASHFSLMQSLAARGEDDYLVVAVHHEACNNYQAGGQAPSRYENTFDCVRRDATWHPARSRNSSDTRIYGIQTATVVGPKGEDIHTDEYGRVRAQFHWDRAGEFDERSSPWVRVMSMWAGTNFGHVSLPRTGQEVVVQFLDGHCDRPLIIGSVYNAANLPPWDLPANRTQSGMLSRSTPDGTAANANAFRFEDKKGQEEVWLHAERDQRIEVEHDESHSVGQDRTKTIGRDEVVAVKRDRTETVDGNEKITIRGNRQETVGRAESIEIGMDRTESVAGDESVHIAGTRSENVDRTKQESILLAKMLTIGAAYQVSVGAAMNTTVGMSQTSQVGLDKSVRIGRRFSIVAGDELSIEVGQSSLRLTSNGTITLSGTAINIGASGVVRVDGKSVDINGGGATDGGGSENERSADPASSDLPARKSAGGNAADYAPPAGDGLVSQERAPTDNRALLNEADKDVRSAPYVIPKKIERSIDPASLFSKEKQQVINAALDKERELVLGKLKEIDRWNDSDRQKFFNAFGTDTDEARQFMKGRLGTIAEINAEATMDNFANAYPDPHENLTDFNKMYAKVKPNDPDRVVMLGPGFWGTPDQLGNTAEGTLAHEHSHIYDPGACIPASVEPICFSIDGVIDRKTGMPYIDAKTQQPLEIYGQDNSRHLLPSQALYHADTINYYIEGTSLPRVKKK